MPQTKSGVTGFEIGADQGSSMKQFKRRAVLLGGVALVATACTQSKFRRYTGPPVTSLRVFKGAGVVQLLNNNKQLKAFRFELGFQPRGHKQFEGDGKTPEGAYLIDRKNPNSRYHLSLGISYPDADDIAFARAHGQRPGGDIFFHGTPAMYIGQPDWTWGCLALSNEDMEIMYSMVNVGIPVYIYP